MPTIGFPDSPTSPRQNVRVLQEPSEPAPEMRLEKPEIHMPEIPDHQGVSRSCCGGAHWGELAPRGAWSGTKLWYNVVGTVERGCRGI